MTTTWKMLWVEDDYSVLRAAVVPLRKKGWHIEACTNYLDAVNVLAAREDFDCFLIDLILPQIGCDVIEDRESKDDPRYLGLNLIGIIREKFGLEKPIIAFSVVHDPTVEPET